MSFELLYMQILCVGILILSAYFGGKISRRFHCGEIVGQVLGGLVAGPVLLYAIGHSIPTYHDALKSLHFFTFLFLGIIVFGIGDELCFSKIKEIGKDVFIVCFIQAFVTWALLTSTFILLGYSTIISLIIGSIGIATAPASTFVIMNKLGITGKMREMLGGIVVLDDVIEVIVFSITVQVALILQGNSFFTWDKLVFPVIKEFLLAILLGVGIFIFLRIVVDKRWLKQKNKSRSGPVLGPEFLSRLISEMATPSIETFILICSCVAIGIGLALHWHLPFLITAVTAGILISNLYNRHVFDSLSIENATPIYTLLFFALIGANADIDSFHPQNFLPVIAYIGARAFGKLFGTWLGCKVTGQDKRFSFCLPQLMLPQAGVAAIEAFFVAVILGKQGEIILSIVLPGLIVLSVVGIFLSERTLLKWRSWATGGGDFIREEDMIKDKLKNQKLDFRNFLYHDSLKVPLTADSKGEVIWNFIQSAHSLGFIENPGDVLEKILERERQGGTTLGEGIAILHCRLPNLENPVVILGVTPNGESLVFGSSKDDKVNIIYMVLSPLERPELHLQILASIAKFLSNITVRKQLLKAENAHSAMKIIRGYDL
jgi:mannitol/fructose-specific phosphotransferase system IIA component (Ntr-type)/Kef-type K+ transport system membrane component KefB